MKNKSYLIFLLIILVFFLLEIKGLDNVKFGDEFSYYYMGKLISEGIKPYRDFFFAHPPLQIYIYGYVIKFFGYNLILLKTIPLLAVLISAFYLFKLIREKFSGLHAIFTILLFLFSYTTMLEATYSYGIEIATTFVIISIYYLMLKEKHFLGGIFYGFATITALQSLALIPALIFVLYLKKQKKILINFLMGFATIFGSVNLLFLLLFKPNYFIDVYKFHFLKPRLQSNNFYFIKNFIFKNWLLVISFLLFFIAKNKKKLLLILGLSIIYIIFLLISSTIFHYYFIILVPLLAILGSYALINLFSMFSKNIKYGLIGLILLVILSNIYTTGTYLIKKDFNNFKNFENIINFVKENSYPNDEVFGDLYLTPIVALYANRKIAFNMVDTNGIRFLADTPPLQEVFFNIKQERTKFVIVRSGIGFGSSKETADFLKENCRLAKKFDYLPSDSIFIFDCSQIRA
jgi:4-amino-4-deoxy-L-arabinose transferase-like glycosyltransferase